MSVLLKRKNKYTVITINYRSRFKKETSGIKWVETCIINRLQSKKKNKLRSTIEALSN